MVGTGTAIALGMGASAAASVIGGAMANSARAKMAKAQLEQAQRDREQMLSFAVPTREELETLQKQVQLYEQNYGRSQGLLKSMEENISKNYDPSLIEAGQQLFQQLNGQESKMLRPIRDQRERQRKNLVNNLTAKLGPGAEASTAGLYALTQFDQETDSLLTNAQDQALGRLVGVAGGLQSLKSSEIGNILNIQKDLSGLLGQIQGTQNLFQTRQMSAISGTPVAPYQGGQYAGEAALGQTIEGIGNLGFKAASTMAGAEIAGNAYANAKGAEAAKAAQQSRLRAGEDLFPTGFVADPLAGAGGTINPPQQFDFNMKGLQYDSSAQDSQKYLNIGQLSKLTG